MGNKVMLSQGQSAFDFDSETNGSSIQQDWQTERDAKNLVRTVEKSRRRLRLRTKVEEPAVFISPSAAADLERDFCAFLLTTTPNEYGRVFTNTRSAPLIYARVLINHRINTWPGAILPNDCLAPADMLLNDATSLSLDGMLVSFSPPADMVKRANWDVPQRIDISPLEQEPLNGDRKVPDAKRSIGLAITSDFAPSKHLVAYWRKGIEHYAKLSEKNERNPFAGAETSKTLDSALRSEFRNRLWSTIIMQLRRARDSRDSQVVVVKKNRYLSEEMETVICNSFALVPRDTTPFLEALSEELYSYFSDGGKKAGEWGRIERADHSVIAILSAKKAIAEPASNARELDVKV